jgi:hypothetical protein
MGSRSGDYIMPLFKYSHDNRVIREDGAVIPEDVDNMDYMQFKEWSKGKTVVRDKAPDEVKQLSFDEQLTAALSKPAVMAKIKEASRA